MCLPLAERGILANVSRVDPGYSEAAAAIIARHPRLASARRNAGSAPVVCWSRDDWERIGDLFLARGSNRVRGASGFVSPKHHIVHLSPAVCSRLDALVYRGERAVDFYASNAVRTLIHEAIHAAGIWPEGEVECYATQLVSEMALELGADASYGAALRKLHWQWQMNEDVRAGSEYYVSDCRAGGPFDLRLGSEVWNLGAPIRHSSFGAP